MPYYTRIFSPSDSTLSIKQLQEVLGPDKDKIEIKIQEGNPIDIRNVLIATQDYPISEIGINPVEDEGLGIEELEEFREEIKTCKPASAVRWINNYFNTVETIYAFRHFDHASSGYVFKILDKVRSDLRIKRKGIIQADHEGFTNESGYHILWQFSDNVTGKWNMAVLSENGVWHKFEMDLGNPKHREIFKEGKIVKRKLRLPKAFRKKEL